MTPKPFVSIIIVNYNGRSLLKNCLDSVFAINYPAHSFEVVVVDNDSRDDSLSFISRYYPKVVLVALNENQGFTGGNIAGFKAAKGEYIVLLNTDTTVDPDWLINMVKAARPSNIGLVAPKIYFSTPFVPLTIETPLIPTSDVYQSTDFKPIGVMIEDITCETSEQSAMIWYKSGFYEELNGAIKTRWTSGTATVLVPFVHKEQETYTFTFHGFPVSTAASIPIKIKLGTTTVLQTTVAANQVQQHTITLSKQKTASHFTWLVQNAGNVIFHNGYGRDRGSAVRKNMHRENSEFYEEDNEYFDKPAELLAVCGASCLIKRQVIDSVGFFDGHYFMYYEDLDLSLRAWKAGWDIVYEPTSVVHHIHKATTGKTGSAFFLTMVEQNHLAFTFTHFPVSTCIVELFLFIARLGITIIKAVVFRFRDNLARIREWNERAEGRMRAAKYIAKNILRLYQNRVAQQNVVIRSYADYRRLLY